MQDLIKEINEKLNSLDFNKIWEGFKIYDYALYNDKNVYLKDNVFPVDNRFLGNTSIKYNNKYIAIWKVTESDKKNIDKLTASLIHEMFHAHQFENNEKRFFNDLEGLKYPYNLENYKLRYHERMYLVDAIKEKVLDRKEKLFSKYLETRLKREKIISGVINYEKAIETVEGCAEYVSLMALKQLSKNEYRNKINNICNSLCELDRKIFDTRTLSYYSGALSCIVASELGIEIIDNIGDSDTYVFDKIQNRKFDTDTDFELELSNNINYEKFEQLFNLYINDIKNSIHSVMTGKNIINKTGKFIICGYDPMNMIRYDNMVLHKRFVFIYDGNEKKYIQGPIITVSKNGEYERCQKLIIKKSKDKTIK